MSRPYKPYVKRLLAGLKSGERVSDLDELELREIIKYHPSSKNKIGIGIDHFKVAGPQWSKHFVIVRIDGSEVDFSYHRCYGNGTQDVMQAARYSINESILAFRENNRLPNGKFRCELTGAETDEVDVDHHPLGFIEIFQKWKGSRSIIEEDVLLEDVRGGLGHQFADQELSRDFKMFHDEHAKLRLLDRSIHRRETKRKRDIACG